MQTINARHMSPKMRRSARPATDEWMRSQKFVQLRFDDEPGMQHNKPVTFDGKDAVLRDTQDRIGIVLADTRRLFCAWGRYVASGTTSNQIFVEPLLPPKQKEEKKDTNQKEEKDTNVGEDDTQGLVITLVSTWTRKYRGTNAPWGCHERCGCCNACMRAVSRVFERLFGVCCAIACHNCCPCACFPCGVTPRYWSWNWAAALIHLANGIATLVLWAESEHQDHGYDLYETSAPWYRRNATTLQCSVEDSHPISDKWCIGRESEPTDSLSLWWLVIVFHLLSFFFQSFAMFSWRCDFNVCGCSCKSERNYQVEVEEKGINPLRMIEYSVSATLMQLAIALILGVWERLAIIGVAFLTVVTMLFGLIAEQLRTDRLALAWVSHLSGWISMGGVWVILGRQFYYTISTSPNKPPDFVYAIVIGIALMYMGFAVVQFVQLCLGKGKAYNMHVEFAYCFLSATSKTFLGWMIFSNALSGMGTN